MSRLPLVLMVSGAGCVTAACYLLQGPAVALLVAGLLLMLGAFDLGRG